MTEPRLRAAWFSPDASAEAAAPDADPVDAYVPPTGCAADVGSDGLFQHLRCAGLYADFDAKRVDPALRAYKPALELWADGATKQRFISIPAGTKIDTSSFDEWIFPNGTRVWKEFRLDGKRVETRLYEKGTDARWRHAAYKWNADESDAERSQNGEKIARGADRAPRAASRAASTPSRVRLSCSVQTAAPMGVP